MVVDTTIKVIKSTVGVVMHGSILILKRQWKKLLGIGI
jgi:hypothetical protein